MIFLEYIFIISVPESSNSLLEANGIKKITGNSLKLSIPKQCPHCTEPNRLETKFCARCGMVLTYDAYNETIESGPVGKERDIAKILEETALLKQAVIEMQNFLKYPKQLEELSKE